MYLSHENYQLLHFWAGVQITENIQVSWLQLMTFFFAASNFVKAANKKKPRLMKNAYKFFATGNFEALHSLVACSRYTSMGTNASIKLQWIRKWRKTDSTMTHLWQSPFIPLFLPVSWTSPRPPFHPLVVQKSATCSLVEIEATGVISWRRCASIISIMQNAIFVGCCYTRTNTHTLTRQVELRLSNWKRQNGKTY